METILDKPQLGAVLTHAVVPRFAGTESVILATGILGATVMPHAIFLHSALTQGRVCALGDFLRADTDFTSVSDVRSYKLALPYSLANYLPSGLVPIRENQKEIHNACFAMCENISITLSRRDFRTYFAGANDVFNLKNLRKKEQP